MQGICDQTYHLFGFATAGIKYVLVFTGEGGLSSDRPTARPPARGRPWQCTFRRPAGRVGSGGGALFDGAVGSGGGALFDGPAGSGGGALFDGPVGSGGGAPIRICDRLIFDAHSALLELISGISNP